MLEVSCSLFKNGNSKYLKVKINRGVRKHQSVKCLLCKHEDLSLILAPREELGLVTCTFTPLLRRQGRIPVCQSGPTGEPQVLVRKAHF